MSSMLSALKQPLTRTYVVTQDSNQGEQGPYLFPVDAFDTWVSANSGYISNVGRHYIVPGSGSGASFEDVVNGDNGRTRLGGNGNLPTYGERKNLKDMGREVVIGNPAESRLFVFRLVVLPPSAVPGDSEYYPGYPCYIIVENNTADVQGNTGRFAVRVARV